MDPADHGGCHRLANIKDIAKEAGVSIATVSRALTRPEAVRPGTIEKVQRAIERLHYTPNAMASSLRRQRSEIVVVVVPDIHNPFYSGIVQGIGNLAMEEGYQILLGETKNQQARMDRYAAMLQRKQADGLIIIGSMLPTQFEAASKDQTLPMVVACEYFEGLPLPGVRIDNVEAAAEAVAYLVAIGHRRIGTISGPLGNRLGADRLNGYKLGMTRAGLEVDPSLIVTGEFSLLSGTEGMQRLLLRDRPTAVFCANDEMAIGAIRALSEAGLSVPGDCSIIGFDDIRFAEFATPPLTTISQPNIRIGETAMLMMLEALAGNKNVRELVLPHRMTVRRSTAPWRG